jgi:hypothetical protein
MKSFETPILFLIFNRPDVTERVFNRIKEIKPTKLYVAADGPRLNKEGEDLICKTTREVITNNIDWPCKVNYLFRDKNLGCGLAVSQGINWFFENEEEGIILEDDCLPDLSFFGFCKEMLEYYRDNSEVMHISGTNFQFGKKWGEGDYYFSYYPHIWGWATWRRAWDFYDFEMKHFDTVLNSKEDYNCIIPKDFFRNTKQKSINTWDFQWMYSVLFNKGKSIIPNMNLVENIGHLDGTHSEGINNFWVFSNRSVSLPNINHPDRKTITLDADKRTYNYVFKLSLIKRIINKVMIWRYKIQLLMNSLITPQ